MKTDEMIAANEFCKHHNIELSFIYSLNDSGLLEIIYIEENIFLPLSELSRLEKMVHLHHELDINLEGIETITYLLQRIKDMEDQMQILSNKLSRYENE